MPMYRQVDVVIEARCIIDTNIDDVMSWCGGYEIGAYFDAHGNPIQGFLLECGICTCLAKMGDYVVFDEDSDFMVMNDETFNSNYEEEIV